MSLVRVEAQLRLDAGDGELGPEHDDTLVLLFLCCRPALILPSAEAPENLWVDPARRGDGSIASSANYVDGTADAMQLSCAGELACIARRDGSVYCWGSNDGGQLGEFRGSLSSPPTAVRIAGLPPTSAVRVSGEHACAAQDHTCAVRRDGSVWCWGSNARGALGTSAGITLAPTVVPL